MLFQTTLPISNETVKSISDLLGPDYTFYIMILIIISVLIYHFLRFWKISNKLKASEKRSENTDTILNLIKIQNENISKMVIPLEILAKGYHGSISKEQVKLITDTKFAKTKFEIIKKICGIIERNNIVENKQQIESDISKYIQNRFDEDVEFMFSFKYHKSRLSSYMNVEWKDTVLKEVRDIVFGKQKTNVRIDNMQRTLHQLFDGFSNDFVSNVMFDRQEYKI